MFEFNLSDISINSSRSKSFKVEVQYSVLLLQVVKEAAIQTPPPPFSDPPHLVCTLGGHCMGKGRVYTNMPDLHNRSPGIEPIPRHWFPART